MRRPRNRRWPTTKGRGIVSDADNGDAPRRLVTEKEDATNSGSSRKKRRFVRALGVAVLVLVLLLGVMKVTDMAMTASERAANPAPGVMVDVGGRRMHVHTVGQGETSIVLLPGLGVPAPVLDFEPLTQELSQWARVTVVEPFGYGWSEGSDSPMLPGDVARDVHTALHGAGVPGPYVLMGHSLAGLYSQKFIETFPGEVSGFVGLDPTNPVTASPLEDDWQASFLSGVLTTLARLGGVRVAQAIRGVDSSLLEQGYSRENVDKQAMLTSWNAMSPEMVRQRKSLKEAVEQTKELRFTQDLPVLVFASRDREKREGGEALRAYAGEGQCHRAEALDAGHYVHHEQHTRINEVTRAFLTECGRMTP